MYFIIGAASLGDKCSDLRVESAPGWGVEAAWWGDDAVVTRSGGLSKRSTGYNWGVSYPFCVLFNESKLNLEFSPQVRRARDALGLWGPHGAGKALWVGFWKRSICAGVTKSADSRAAKLASLEF